MAEEKKKEELRNRKGVEKDPAAKVVNVISIPSQLFRRLFSPPPFSNQTFPTEGSLGRQVDGNLPPRRSNPRNWGIGNCLPVPGSYHHGRTLQR